MLKFASSSRLDKLWIYIYCPDKMPAKRRNMYWDDKYKSDEHVWGKEPSKLAVAAIEYLQKCKSTNEILSVLDIGCGYGRDVFYFLENLRCRVLGIDISEKAIDIASSAAAKARKENVKFQCLNFMELKGNRYDIVFISSLYQLLKKEERKELVETVMKTLKPNGLLFLSTLSIRDPEHAGKGVPVTSDPNSLQDKVYLHLCTREELVGDFVFLNIKELYEHEYYEPHATGETHHHLLWILIGEYTGTSHNAAQLEKRTFCGS